MTRLANALRLELTLQVRQGFLHAAIFSGLIWLSVLLPLSHGLRPVAEPYILLGDTCIIGFFFIAGTVFFEKQERTLGAVISTPLRFWEYLSAKLTLLVLISLFVALVVPTISARIRLPPLAFGGRGGARDTADAARRVRLVAAVRVDQRLVPGGDDPARGDDGASRAVLFRRVAESAGYVVPTTGPLLLLGAAFRSDNLAPWQVVYALAYPMLWIVALWWVAKAMFVRYVIAGREACDDTIADVECQGVSGLRPQRHSRHIP